MREIRTSGATRGAGERPLLPPTLPFVFREPATKGRRQNHCLVVSTLFLFQVVIAMSSGITRAWQAP